jgi:hypothetical protein
MIDSRQDDPSVARSDSGPATAADRDAPRPYGPPRLRVYGDLAQITASVGSHGKADGGNKSGKRKTGF